MTNTRSKLSIVRCMFILPKASNGPKLLFYEYIELTRSRNLSKILRNRKQLNVKNLKRFLLNQLIIFFYLFKKLLVKSTIKFTVLIFLMNSIESRAMFFSFITFEGKNSFHHLIFIQINYLCSVYNTQNIVDFTFVKTSLC